MDAAARGRRPVVVFDGDDTLWMTEPLYDEARAEAAAVVAAAGVDPLRWEQLQLDLDVTYVATLGLSSERFPASCVAAYDQLAGAAADPSVAAAVAAAAATVFTRPAPRTPGAVEALAALGRSHTLALLTQGDDDVQQRRIAASGLASAFTTVRVVPRKDRTVLKRFLTSLRADISRSWFVGNSVVSDINPATACGLRAVWIDAYVWAHERRQDLARAELVVPARALADVPSIVAAADAAAIGATALRPAAR